MITETESPEKTKKRLFRYKINPNQKPIDLYLCTIYPGTRDKYGSDYTPQMKFNYEILNDVPGLNLHALYIPAGYFSHRHPKGTPDPVQIQWRNQYLSIIPIGSWFLVMDSDETIGGAVNRIPDTLRIMEQNGVDYGSISEIKADMDLKVRPRFIYKKHDFMSYGGKTQRHDVIWTCDCGSTGAELKYHLKDEKQYGYCLNGYNFIDVTAKDRSWILDHLYFNHYKDGSKMTIFGLNKPEEIPENLAALQDTEEEVIVLTGRHPKDPTIPVTEPFEEEEGE